MVFSYIQDDPKQVRLLLILYDQLALNIHLRKAYSLVLSIYASITIVHHE